MKYNVGDKVRIKSIDWYNENKDEGGYVICGEYDFVPLMSRFCGKILTIDVEFEDGACLMMEDTDGFVFTYEMFEGLVGEETKPKFNVGDRVITDTNMKGKIIEVVEEGWYSVEFEPYNGIPQPNSVVPEESMSLVEESDDFEKMYMESEKRYEKEYSKGEYCHEQSFKWGFQEGYDYAHENEKLEINLKNGYVFKDENGNEILTSKIILEKKKEIIPNLQLDSVRTVREYDTVHSRIWLEIYEDNPTLCIFTHLWVDEDHRRKGYGTKALEQAEIIAKDLGCNTIQLKVETYSWMSKWYLRLGYKFLTNAEDNYTWLTKSI